MSRQQLRNAKERFRLFLSECGHRARVLRDSLRWQPNRIDPVFYMNINDTGRLESFVLFQDTTGLFAKQSREAGIAPNDALALAELHSEVLSRIDNARVPPGGYVEYSKYFDTQKFAIRFK
jgi:hypothetical protein